MQNLLSTAFSNVSFAQVPTNTGDSQQSKITDIASTKLDEIKHTSLIDLNLKRMIEDLIKDFISCYLHPYLTGEITAETENTERGSLLSLLLSMIEGSAHRQLTERKDLVRFIDSNKEILSTIRNLQYKKLHQNLIDAYVKQSIVGLYIYFFSLPETNDKIKKAKHHYSYTQKILLTPECSAKMLHEPGNTIFDVLITTLKHSMAIDFPDIPVEDPAFQRKVKDLWDSVNSERWQSHAEAVTWPAVRAINPKAKVEETHVVGIKAFPENYQPLIKDLIMAFLNFSTHNEIPISQNKKGCILKLNILNKRVSQIFAALPQNEKFTAYQEDLFSFIKWERMYIQGLGDSVNSPRTLPSINIAEENRKLLKLFK